MDNTIAILDINTAECEQRTDESEAITELSAHELSLIGGGTANVSFM
jgi:hypothetical protein